MGRKIQITHLPSADEIQKIQAIASIEKTYDKIALATEGELFLEVHFRESHKGKDKKELIDVKANATGPGMALHASFSGWDGEKALKQTLLALEKEAEKVKTTEK